MHHLILGAGGAGLAAAQAIRSRDENARITIATRDEHLPYSLCSLPSLLAGELDTEAMYRFTQDVFNG